MRRRDLLIKTIDFVMMIEFFYSAAISILGARLG